MNTQKHKKTSYRDAGVDIEKGNQLVDRIKTSANSTHIAGVMDGLGSFGALFDMSKHNYKDPILVSGTDGVGTKLKLAIDMNKHDTIGIDLVAMCVNDLLVQGAQPLFFLDYFACATLDVETAAIVIDGIAHGCRLAGCALIGGETAEMPGMYQQGEYDLAGFCVGAVERTKLIDGSLLKKGNALIAVASSGLHSNGFSLVRKILEQNNINLEQSFDNNTLGEILLEPTSIYTGPIHELLEQVHVNAISHITGGGLIENIPRVIPKGLKAVIDTGSWQWPPIFTWLQEQGNINTNEMYRTFNCGVGMVICVAENDKSTTIDCLNKGGASAWEIGVIHQHEEGTEQIVFQS